MSLGAEHQKITIVKDSGGTELLENSVVAISLAVFEGADYLELPVNLTGDGHLVVFRDTTLNRTTNVAEIFPERSRDDGSHYLVDFTLLELRQLRIKKLFEDERNGLSGGVPSLNEALALIKRLNDRYQKSTGVVIALNDSGFYRSEDKDLGAPLRATLRTLSYEPEDKLFIQSSDPDELQKIATWPTVDNSDNYSLIQEIELKVAEETDFFGEEKKEIIHSWLLTNSGRRILATYADAVKLPKELMHTQDPAVQEFIQSLSSFDIKTFIDSPESVQSSQPDSGIDPYHQNDITEKITIDFQGVYVESVEKGKAVAKFKQDSSLPATQEGENSDLPPFFSNLGLTAPGTTDPNEEETQGENREENEW